MNEMIKVRKIESSGPFLRPKEDLNGRVSQMVVVNSIITTLNRELTSKETVKTSTKWRTVVVINKIYLDYNTGHKTIIEME